MPVDDVAALVRRSYETYVTKDRETLERLIADDFHFTSPYDDHIDRKTYFERCWPNSARMRDLRIEKLFTDGNEAFVRYEVELMTGEKFRNTEFLRTESGKLKEVEVYFGSK